MHATLFLATLLPVVGVLAGDVTPFTPVQNLFPLAPVLSSPLRYRGLVERQAGASCRTGESLCGTGCITTASQICCPDQAHSCQSSYYCSPLSSGGYGCCPRGEVCNGVDEGCRTDQKTCGDGCIPLAYTCCPDQQGACRSSEYCVQTTPNSQYSCCPNGSRCSGSTGGGSPAPSPSTTAAPARSSSTSTSSSSSSSARPSTSPISSAEEPDETDSVDVPSADSPSSTSSTTSSTTTSPNNSPTLDTGATATAGAAGGSLGPPISAPTNTAVSTPRPANSGVKSSTVGLLWAAGVIIAGMALL